MGMTAILVSRLLPFQKSFIPLPTEAPYEILSKFGTAVSEWKLFEILNNCPIQMFGAHTNAQGSKHDLDIKRTNVKVRQSF